MKGFVKEVKGCILPDYKKVEIKVSPDAERIRLLDPFPAWDGKDMTALPPGKCAADKHYLGFFDRETLVAVLDLIERYPQDDTAYIGFFMTKKERQGYGLGTALIGELLDELRREKFCKVRLAVDRGNPQSKAFWEKNGFALMGEEFPHGDSAYLPMECAL